MLENIENGMIHIEKNATIEEFLQHYQRTKIHDPNKRFVSRMTEKLFHNTDTDYRVYLVSVGGEVLAGAVFIDEGVTSEYWASFYHDDSRPYHLGIAIMDAWFLDSYEK